MLTSRFLPFVHSPARSTVDIRPNGNQDEYSTLMVSSLIIVKFHDIISHVFQWNRCCWVDIVKFKRSTRFGGRPRSDSDVSVSNSSHVSQPQSSRRSAIWIQRAADESAVRWTAWLGPRRAGRVSPRTSVTQRQATFVHLLAILSPDWSIGCVNTWYASSK
jgi:hypothetical protein